MLLRLCFSPVSKYLILNIPEIKLWKLRTLKPENQRRLTVETCNDDNVSGYQPGGINGFYSSKKIRYLLTFILKQRLQKVNTAES